MSDTAKELRERLTLKYVADCKCGNCQLVDAALITRAAQELEQLWAAFPVMRAQLARCQEQFLQMADLNQRMLHVNQTLLDRDVLRRS